jgi:hypothetical protein
VVAVVDLGIQEALQEAPGLVDLVVVELEIIVHLL